MATTMLAGPQFYKAVVGEVVEDLTKIIFLEKFDNWVMVWSGRSLGLSRP